MLSATLAGLAGSLKALVFQLASLTDVHWNMSGEVVLMTLVGGLGTVFGPVVGAFVIVAMENYLAPFGQWVLVIQGVIFVVCVLCSAAASSANSPDFCASSSEPNQRRTPCVVGRLGDLRRYHAGWTGERSPRIIAIRKPSSGARVRFLSALRRFPP